MKLKVNKKIVGLSLSLVIVTVFLLIKPAHAGWGNDILAGIVGAIISALGWVLVQLMGVLVSFAQYNGFIQATAVVNGWVIVRDVCNMFFVLILLIIAFATILQIEEYNYKKWLPKLILMAVLINFSKTICGLLIDGAQIVMLTFVNSFKDIAGGNLTSALGISDWQKMGNDLSGSSIDWEITASLILALIYVIIAVIVIAAMLAMIAMRIVMLWIYVVLSPLAYLLSAFPDGKKYASQWWSQFTQNLIVGPVLAFFIWLSFTSLASFNGTQFANPDLTSGVTTSSTDYCTVHAGAAGCGSSGVLIKFIIAIGMLLGGMKITQEIGGVAGSAAGSVFSKGKALSLKGAKGIGGAVGGLVGTYSGYDSMKRRYGEFKKNTKEKIMAKQDLAYETVKGGIRGTISGLKNPNKPLGEREKEVEKARYKAFNNKTDQSLEKDKKRYEYDEATKKYKRTTINSNGESVDEFAKDNDGKDIVKMTDKEAKGYEKSERKEIKKTSKKKSKDEEKRLLDAYNNGVYKDEKGVEYEYKDGKYVNKKGETATHIVKNEKGEETEENIKKMDDESARVKNGMKNGMLKADALRNNIKQDKEAKEQKILEDAGVSTTELKRIMNDSTVNKDRRLAAAMTLAIKNGFKNNNHASGRQDVNNAKALIGDNDIILKKFNEAVNKNSAHLNYDLESDKGRKEFKQGMDDGKIDGYGQDGSAYKSSSLIKTLKDYSGIDFADNISRVSQKSSQNRDNVSDGLHEALNEDLKQPNGTIYDEDKEELNPYAKLIARLSGNMKNAFTGLDGEFNEKAATKYMEIAKPSWLANFDTDQLKKNNDPQNPEHDDLVDKINKAMAKGIQVNNIVSLEKAGSNPDLVRRLIGEVIKLKDTTKIKQIEDNNILRNIKAIPGK